MSVVSIEFFVLLAATIALLAAAPAAVRKYVLLAASGVFAFTYNPASALIVIAIISVNYLLLARIAASDDDAAKSRCYLASIVFNVAVFVGFKLAFEPAPNLAATTWPVLGLSIGYPLGLSFVILMLHGAVTDVYSGKLKTRTGYGTFLLFGGFFPYLSAGPIERLPRMQAALDAPVRPRLEDLRVGVSLIALGLAKKLIAANRIKVYVDAVFSGDQAHSAPTVALAIALNAAYVYCDFSAYTDIARGAARCLGIDLQINFDKPFRSRSVTEFWRRWHISFSNWLRDYLFMPLAYSLGRMGAAGAMAALLTTFVLCGFWHRAAATFLLFGLLHGVAMCAEMRFGAKRGPSLARAVAAHTYTLAFLGLTIVLFSADDLAHAGAIFAGLVSPAMPAPAELFGYKGPFLFLLMLVGIAVWQGLERWRARLTPEGTPWFLLAVALLTLFLGQSEGGGFVYAQF